MAYTTLKTQLIRDGLTHYKVRYSESPDEQCMWVKTKTGASQSELDALVDQCLLDISEAQNLIEQDNQKMLEINIPLTDINGNTNGRTI
jgi:hypothetical protein